MNIYYPHYYKDFACIASRCPDSCCQEWEVDVDPEAVALYRSLSGELGDRLRSVLRNGDDGWASMAITSDRRCPMWRADGLCDIQAALGHEALCKTCREFPRLTHDYGDFQEWGLELSCPEAARLILASTESGFCREEIPGGDDPEYDQVVMNALLLSRRRVLNLLARPEYDLGQALAVLFLYGLDVNLTLFYPDEMPILSVPEYLADGQRLAQPGEMADIFGIYRDLEILTPEWQTLLDKGPVDAPWLPEHRAMAIYLVQRYWLQAVSDGDLLCRVKFILTACLTVRHLDAPVLRAAQLWSKEIENSSDNVEEILYAAYHSPALADTRLLDLVQK